MNAVLDASVKDGALVQRKFTERVCACVCVCVCVFVSLSEIRCDNEPLHLVWLNRRGHVKKETRKKFSCPGT